MKTTKRILALVLVLVMALALVACVQPNPGTTAGKQPDGTTAGKQPDGTTAPQSNLPAYLKVGQAPLVEGEDITLKVAIRCHDNTQKPEETWQFKFIEEILGVDIELVDHFYDAQKAESISLLFAGGDLPDLMIGFGLDTVQLTQYGTIDEQLLDLAPYLNEENAPNIMKASAADPNWMKALTNSEGKVYSLGDWSDPDPDSEYAGAYRLYYNWDVMNEAGITEAPKTLDEFMVMLRAIKAKFPNMYPFGGNYARYNATYLIMNALGFNYSMGGETANQRSHEYDIGLRNGEVTLFGYDKEMLPVYLEYMTQIYAEGLMHPDYYTLEKDATKALLTNPIYDGKYGSFAVFSEVPGLYGGNEFGTQWWGGVPMTSELNDTPFYPNCRGNYEIGNWCVSADTEYPELCVALADLFFLEDGKRENLASFIDKHPSVEDVKKYPELGMDITVGWHYDAEQQRVVYPEWEAQKEKYTDQNYWVFENLTCWYNGSFGSTWMSEDNLDEFGNVIDKPKLDLGEYNVDETAYKRHEYPEFTTSYSYQFQYTAQNCWGQYMTDENTPQVCYFGADTTARIADLKTLIKPYIEQSLAEFITGKKELNQANLDAYSAELESLGADEYVKIYADYWEALNG